MLKLISLIPYYFIFLRLLENVKLCRWCIVYFDWTALLLSIEVISLFCYSGNLDKDGKYDPPGVAR